MSAASSVLKQALKRLPMTTTGRGLIDVAAVTRLSANTTDAAAGSCSYISQNATTTTTATTKRWLSSAAAALDEEKEREALYGAGGTSPITEYFNLAVQGHTVIGPPPKYRPSESVTLKCGIPEDALSFTTSSYDRLIHTPHVPHQEHKVTLSVRWHILPLNDFEKRILMEIVGGRYKPENNELRLSSEQFGSRIENKRHLVSMLDRLVFAARKLAVEAQKQQQQTHQQEAEAASED